MSPTYPMIWPQYCQVRYRHNLSFYVEPTALVPQTLQTPIDLRYLAIYVHLIHSVDPVQPDIWAIVRKTPHSGG